MFSPSIFFSYTTQACDRPELEVDRCGLREEPKMLGEGEAQHLISNFTLVKSRLSDHCVFCFKQNKVIASPSAQSQIPSPCNNSQHLILISSEKSKNLKAKGVPSLGYSKEMKFMTPLMEELRYYCIFTYEPQVQQEVVQLTESSTEYTSQQEDGD